MTQGKKWTVADRIADRWQRWLPWATVAARQESLGTGVKMEVVFDRIRDIHSRACRAALDAGVTWTAILRMDIDCPFSTPEERSRWIISAQKRRTRKLKSQQAAVERRANARRP